MKLWFIDKKIAVWFCILLAALAALGSFGAISVKTANEKRKIPIYCVQTEKKQVAVTFDSAWDDSDLDEILEALKKYECPATFFVVGDFIEKYPDRVKAMYESGNEIASHADTHPHMNALSRDEMIKEMDGCDEKIRKITNQKDVLFRAPYGEYNNLLVQTCEDTKRFCIQWDCEALATVGNPRFSQ